MPAILSNAASILVGHNHPSCKSAESREDVEVTKRLVEAGKIIGINVLDHIVLGDGEYDSSRKGARPDWEERLVVTLKKKNDTEVKVME